MPRSLQLSKPAESDISEIWLYTAESYSTVQADSYATLIDCAFDDLEEDPERPASRRHPELGAWIRSYPIALRKHRSGVRIRSPRHIVFYTLEFEDMIYVMRILHDSMDPIRHLSEG